MVMRVWYETFLLIMINDIRRVQASNLVVKFADDINVGIMVTMAVMPLVWRLTILRSGRKQIK